MVSKMIARVLQKKGGRHMDKQTSETIKIKINGKDRPLSQAEEAQEKIPFSSWEEKLKAENEVASAKQPVDKEDEFPWLLPDEDDQDFKDDPKVVTPSKKKKLISNQTITPYLYPNKNNRKQQIISFPLKRILTIFLLAVGLGVVFGYVALNFLSNEDMPATATPSEVIDDAVPIEENSDKQKEDTQAAATSTATLQLYAVQGGIFSAKDGAETVASDIKGKGFASVVMEIDGSYTVFAGLGKEKTETDSLNGLYKQKEFPDFWGGKQLSLKIATGSSADQWVSSIQDLSSFASSAANGKSITEEDVNKIETTLMGIKTSNETEKSLVDKLLQAAESIKNNQGWDAQQNLLEVISKLNSK